jgi:hypothetical protein
MHCEWESLSFQQLKPLERKIVCVNKSDLWNGFDPLDERGFIGKPLSFSTIEQLLNKAS